MQGYQNEEIRKSNTKPAYDMSSGKPESIHHEKHVNLNLAIVSIRKVTEHCERLLDKIHDREPTVKEKIPESPECISLMQLLIEGPDRIRAECEEAHKILDVIKNDLFK